MFQTEVIIFLQSLATDGFTTFMNVVTSLGDDKTLALVLLIIPFGVSLPKGILLLQIFMWTQLVTDSLKSIFGLPRPAYVNANVQNLQHSGSDPTLFVSPGAETFWGQIEPDVVEAFRASGNDSYGFPSGHVSSTVALWGGMALLFDKWILHWAAAVLIVLVSFSRMYLGRHFLGDVLGGILVGALILIIFRIAFEWWHIIEKFLRSQIVLKLGKYIFWFGVPLAATLLFPDAVGKSAGYLLGVNAASLVLTRHGLPDDTAPWWKRSARAAIAILLYFGAYGIYELLLEITGLDDVRFIEDVLQALVLILVSIVGTVRLSLKWGLYSHAKTESDITEPSQMPA